MDMLVSTNWLAERLGETGLVVLDASMHLPGADRSPQAEFAAGHIPGARFLDLPSLKDEGSPVHSALPTAGQFAERMRSLGVATGDRVVLYDASDLRTSARAWFMFDMFGIEAAVLDGGLAKWTAEDRPLEQGETDAFTSDFDAGQDDRSHVRSKTDMLANVATREEQVVDARDADRFTGATKDTVHDLPGGHIPGSKNLFFRKLLREDGTFKPKDELRATFAEAGIDLSRPVVSTCGSATTASVLDFALRLLGKDDTAVYDGSWSEWGADPATPKETGEAD